VRNRFGSALSPLPVRERMKVRVLIQRLARFGILLLKDWEVMQSFPL
jgi:hypothetical protein